MAPFKQARNLKPGDTITRYLNRDMNLTVTTAETKGFITIVTGESSGAFVRKFFEPSASLTVVPADPFEGLS